MNTLYRTIQGVSLAILLFAGLTSSLAAAEHQYQDGVLVCEMPDRGFYTAADEQRIETALESLRAALASMDSPDHQVANVLLSSSRTARIDGLIQLTRAYPDNRFAAVQTFNACYSNPGHEACLSDELADRAAALDPDNGAMWYMQAAWRHRRGNEFGVSAAFRAALNANEFNDYFQYFLRVAESALPDLDDDIAIAVYAEVLNTAATALLVNYNSIPGFCQSRASSNPDLANLCIKVGERIEQDSGAMISRMLGTALQSVAYRAMGDTINAERLDNAEWLRDPQREASAAMQLMFHDAELAKVWFDALLEGGEMASMEAVFQEARRRSADADYFPCR